jgi:hypothetical protein
MKKVSARDFIIGALMATLFLMLLGAGTNKKMVGRYQVAVGGGGAGYSVCVLDSTKGETRCVATKRTGGFDTTMGQFGKWTFDPFSDKPDPLQMPKDHPGLRK